MGVEATIHTTRGDIRIRLTDRETPKTVENFTKLAFEGFYNGLRFHRVIQNFMIQAGCPNGDGRGGPGYEIDCEIVPTLKHERGVISMAHTGACKHDKLTGVRLKGRCTNGSQFFITRTATPHLDGVHTVFGHVLEGQEVVDQIRQGDQIQAIEIEYT